MGRVLVGGGARAWVDEGWQAGLGVVRALGGGAAEVDSQQRHVVVWCGVVRHGTVRGGMERHMTAGTGRPSLSLPLPLPAANAILRARVG